MPSILLVFAALLPAIWVLRRALRLGSRETGLPPGPPTVPILGNLLDLPQKHAFLKFQEWAKTYGEIYSLKFGHTTAVVLNSPRMIHELLDNRSAVTSDRPDMLVPVLATNGLNLVFARYGTTWKNMRRAVHDILTREACMRHLPIQRAESTQLMYDILNKPEDFYIQIRRYSASVITSVVFGSRSPHHESHVVQEFAAVQRKWDNILEPGATPPIDIFTFLRYVPERWAEWKQRCKEIKRRQQGLYFGLAEACEKRIQEDRRNGCFMEFILDNQDSYRLDKEMIGYTGGILLEAGSDTTAIFLQFLICCLTAYPEVQRRAQKEIDEVVGKDRSPSLEDIESLPYINAIIHEVHRFRPIVPVGIPHRITQQEIVDGYVIPKGSTIFWNIWAISHDEEAFDRPDEFIPERFLTSEFGTKSGVDDTARRHDMPFGAGRRICPGIQLANNSIIMNTMNLIWAFDFKPTVDPTTGKVIPVDPNNLTEGVLSAPKPFLCDIKPRSESHADIIRGDFADARATFAPFEQELSPQDADFVAKY